MKRIVKWWYPCSIHPQVCFFPLSLSFYKGVQSFSKRVELVASIWKADISSKNPGSWHLFKKWEDLETDLNSLRHPLASQLWALGAPPLGMGWASPAYCCIHSAHLTRIFYSLPNLCEHLGLHPFFRPKQTVFFCFTANNSLSI